MHHSRLFQIVEWVRETKLYYEAAIEEWAETGAIHYDGKSTLDNFMKAVRIRCGKSWQERLRPFIKRFYFEARENGVVRGRGVRVAQTWCRLSSVLDASSRERRPQQHDLTTPTLSAGADVSHADEGGGRGEAAAVRGGGGAARAARAGREEGASELPAGAAGESCQPKIKI